MANGNWSDIPFCVPFGKYFASCYLLFVNTFITNRHINVDIRDGKKERSLNCNEMKEEVENRKTLKFDNKESVTCRLSHAVARADFKPWHLKYL
jgi:hypothetical protein